MNKLEIKNINILKIKELAKKHEIVLVGAGRLGTLVQYILNKYSIKIKYFFDNKVIGEKNGISVLKPQKFCKEMLYILTIDSKYHEELYTQLHDLGIKTSNIFIYNPFDRNYLKILPESEYKIYISAIFYIHHGYEMNWKNPCTYSEIVNFEKIYDHNPLKTKLADKFLAREYINKKIGAEYLTELYGVWERAEDINFDKLPQKFVLKANNGCKRNIIVKDKSKINIDETIAQLNKWMNENFFYDSFEWQYKNIEPKIICEEYLEGIAEYIREPQFFCFHGEPKYIRYIQGAHTIEGKAGFYSPKWEKLPLGYAYPIDANITLPPKNLNKMIEISRELSAPFKHSRIDFYDLPDGRLLLGEITFSSTSGLIKFEPIEYDLIWGNLINMK